MQPLTPLLLLTASLAADPARVAAAATPPAEPPTLSVRDLIAPGQTAAPSRRALALAGSRVRLVGFMARQEEPTPDGFWLTAGPVECDEGGGGTGDLPPGAVRVLLAGEPPAPIEGPIAVTGLLEVGNEAAGDGPPSSFRLRIGPPANSSLHEP